MISSAPIAASSISGVLAAGGGSLVTDLLFDGFGIKQSATLIRQVSDTVLDLTQFQDTPLPDVITQLFSRLACGSSTATNATLQGILTEHVALLGQVVLAFQHALTDGVGAADDCAESVFKLVQTADQLVVSGVVATRHEAYQLLIELLGLTASTERFFQSDATDQLGVQAALQGAVQLFTQLSDALSLSATGTYSLVLLQFVQDAVDVDSVLSTAGTQLSAQLAEGFKFAGILNLPDAQYTAWVMNTETLAPTEYTNYPFNSFAKLGQKYLGATETGIFELTGSNDAGTNINAAIRSGLLDFGTSLKKRVPYAYLGYTSTGRLLLKVGTTDQGTKVEDWYELTETQAAPDSARFKIGKGLQARYWQFELTNAEGADFALDQVQFYPLVLSRRL